MHPHTSRDPPLLARFRPTRRQALGRGLYLGALAAVGLTLVAVTAVALPELVDLVDGGSWAGPSLPPVGWAALAGLPMLVGAVVGLGRGRQVGIDVDDVGIHRVPPGSRSFGPWQRVADIRAERLRRRTVVTVYLDSGRILHLRAPYDGELLGRDPEFERKIFTLRNLWETHRSWYTHGRSDPAA